MDRKEAIKILKTWALEDREMRGYSTESDFDKFCEERNVAIDTVVEELDIPHMDTDELRKNISQEDDKLRGLYKEIYGALYKTQLMLEKGETESVIKMIKMFLEDLQIYI